MDRDILGLRAKCITNFRQKTMQYNPDYPRQCGPRPPRKIENSDNTKGLFGVHKLLS
jgi:hypothetical protein